MNDQKGTEFQRQWLDDLAGYLKALQDDFIHPEDRPYYIAMIKRELEEVRDRIASFGRYLPNQTRVQELLAAIEEVEQENGNPTQV